MINLRHITALIDAGCSISNSDARELVEELQRKDRVNDRLRHTLNGLQNKVNLWRELYESRKLA